MELKKLKKMIDKMTSVVDDMQTEALDFLSQKSEWYDRNLMLYRSGAITADQWNEIWDAEHSLSTDFDDDLRRLQRDLVVLEERYETFKKKSDKLKELMSKPHPIPEGWKEYEIEYRFIRFEGEAKKCLIGPDEEYVKARFLDSCDKSWIQVYITGVKEVKDGTL